MNLSGHFKILSVLVKASFDIINKLFENSNKERGQYKVISKSRLSCRGFFFVQCLKVSISFSFCSSHQDSHFVVLFGHFRLLPMEPSVPCTTLLLQRLFLGTVYDLSDFYFPGVRGTQNLNWIPSFIFASLMEIQSILIRPAIMP